MTSILSKVWLVHWHDAQPLPADAWGPGHRAEVHAGLATYQGLDAAAFTTTVEVYDRRQLVGSGRLHSLTPGLWCWLAPVAALHLSDRHGQPMHAVENGLYWAGLSGLTRYRDGTSWVTLPDHRRLAGLLRISTHRAEAMVAVAAGDRDRFTQAVLALRPEWQREADKAIQLLLDHGATTPTAWEWSSAPTTEGDTQC